MQVPLEAVDDGGGPPTQGLQKEHTAIACRITAHLWLCLLHQTVMHLPAL